MANARGAMRTEIYPKHTDFPRTTSVFLLTLMAASCMSYFPPFHGTMQHTRQHQPRIEESKVPSSYGFILRQSPRPRHLPEGNQISERHFFGFVEKPAPLRASLHNKAEKAKEDPSDEDSMWGIGVGNAHRNLPKVHGLSENHLSLFADVDGCVMHGILPSFPRHNVAHTAAPALNRGIKGTEFVWVRIAPIPSTQAPA